MNYQYDFLVKGDKTAWDNLWFKSVEVCKKIILKELKKRKKKGGTLIASEELEDKALTSVMYVLRRYKTTPGYVIYSSFLTQLYGAVRVTLFYKKKNDKLVEYVPQDDFNKLLIKKGEGENS